MDSRSLLLVTGGLAILGGVVNGISDYLLQGGLAAGEAINTFENLPAVPYNQIYWGSIIGNAAIPLWMFGFWPVYKALEPAGPWLALPPVFLFVYLFALFPGYHGSYALYAAGFQAQFAGSPETIAPVTEMVERLIQYHDSIMLVIGVPMMVGSIWLIVAMLSGKTLYARWMVLLSPLLVPLTQSSIETLPAPYGAIIRPAWGTTLFTLFFLMSLIVCLRTKPRGA